MLKHDQEFQIGATRLKLHTTGIPDAATVMAAQKEARELKPDEGVLTGKTIKYFELGPIVARGRTGTIYKARDTRNGKDVAVKVLHADFAGDEEDVQRFIRRHDHRHRTQAPEHHRDLRGGQAGGYLLVRDGICRR